VESGVVRCEMVVGVSRVPRLFCTGAEERRGEEERK
jgi:hypothetical protein